MQTVAVERDDLGALRRLHPNEFGGFVFEVAARLDDLSRGHEQRPDRPHKQRAVGGGQPSNQRRESLDALLRPGVVVALRAALLALPAVDLKLPREVGTDDAERLSSSEKHFQLVDGAALLDPRRVGLALLLDLDLA